MDVVTRIERYNAGRDAQLLQRKYARIAANPFAFLRGTCHLFYADWNAGRTLDDAPFAWICGDLHLENMGSYKGDNRLPYFDLNDFDEAALAPCTWEISRFLVSLHVAAKSLGLGIREARELAQIFIDAYVNALIEGKPRWLERDIATGIIARLLHQVGLRRRKDFLNARTHKVGKQRRLNIDGDRLLEIPQRDREALLEWFKSVAATQDHPKFLKPLDIARRVAGTGSLGQDRYAILVRGTGSPNGNYLLDLKLGGTSSAGTRLKKLQPAWTDEATRIITVQKRAQAVEPALLMPLRYAGASYVLKELQPTQDRLDLSAANVTAAKLRGAMRAMAQLVAWSALRSSGRAGAATADNLIAFASDRAWIKPLHEYVETYQSTVTRDWRAFRKNWLTRNVEGFSPVPTTARHKR